MLLTKTDNRIPDATISVYVFTDLGSCNNKIKNKKQTIKGG